MLGKLILIGVLGLTRVYAQDEQQNWTLWPVWDQDSTAVDWDTLEHEQKKPVFQLNRNFYTGLGIAILSSAAAWKFHQQAEKAYSNYLREGDLSKIDRYYNRAGKNDRYAVASFVGIQAGIILIIKSIYK